MMCKGKSRKGLCPVSLGLALGLVMGLAVLIMPQFSGLALPTSDLFYAAFLAFLRGLAAGFFIALFYDLISCCCKMRCCSGGCGCGCKCCDSNDGTCVCNEKKPPVV